MKGRIITAIVALVMLLSCASLSACSTFKARTPKTVEEVQEILEQKGYECHVLNSSVEEMDFEDGEEMLICLPESGDYVIRFFVHSSVADADDGFEFLAKRAVRGADSKAETHLGGENWEKTQINAGGVFTVLCRIDNTLLDVEFRSADKDIAKGIAKDLGY